MERFEDFDEEEQLDFASLSKEEREALVREHNASLLSPEEIKRIMKETGTEVVDLHRVKNGEEPHKVKDTGRLGSLVDMAVPQVRGLQIRTREELRALIDREYPALREKKDFERRLKEADVHLDLLRKYGHLERLPYGAPTRIARELGVDPETIRNWTGKKMTPRLYTYMEWATPKSEAESKIEDILNESNGIRNMDDVQSRLDTYYFGDVERNSRFYKRELKKVEKYYAFLEEYFKGGMLLDIAKKVRLSESGARNYLAGALPRLVSIAIQIPSEPPRYGCKWLPMVSGTNAVRDDWIQVPEQVKDYRQVLEVLNQISPLENKDMTIWEKKYGSDYHREEGFMHLLGTYVSDSRVSSSSTISNAFAINLSKNYEWSVDFGEASCFHLGQIGIKAHQTADKEPSVADIETETGMRQIHAEAQYEWQSENSPLLKWIRKSCLGYDDSAKTYQKVDSEWILDAPRNLRVAFLQGYADGDGGVSSRSYYFAISTHSDHETVENLLQSLGVDTHRTKKYVRTANFQAVKNIAEIPPFKYARDRQRTLEKTVKMIEARRLSPKANPPSQEEIIFMKQLRAEGVSYGLIGEHLFDKYGYTLDPRNIRDFIENQ
ncbi:MAG: hypothetical protein BAJATHORv1_10531 [Candidatus Thorarchaeota archaeon]|nr:MAG: hypothetical protein BAJATHORv1_10531 [Candidatus Thorarchaeota archaeon]